MLKNYKIIESFEDFFLKSIRNIDKKKIYKFGQILLSIKKKKKKILIFGNGAGQSISNHFAVDLTKNSNIKCLSFNEGNHITCYANDYGFVNWILKTINKFYEKGDLVILISSSGESKNILNAAKFCKKNEIKFITFSGFKKNNKLSNYGQINFWVNSLSYNIVEVTHLYILLVAVDFCKGKLFYSNN